MFGALKEFYIYLKYRKMVKSEAASDIIWTRRGLRYDWLCRIYTVIKPINEYLGKVGLEEMISVSLDPIQTTNNESYLVVYYFVFRKLTWFWFIFYSILLPVSSIWAIIHFLF
jgi:hypothetical protein